MGGDVLFDGDDRIFAFRARRGDVLGAALDLARLRAVHYAPTPAARLERLLVRPLLKSLVPGAALRLWRAAQPRAAMSWAGPKLKAFLRDAPRGAGLASEVETAAHYREALGSRLFLDGFDLRCASEIQEGCEHAAPYVDARLVRFLARLPPEAFFAGGRMRGLLREAMQGTVPDRVRLREDKWFPGEALGQLFFAAGGKDALRAEMRMTALGDLGFVEPRAFADRFDAFARDPRDGKAWFELWPALALESLMASRGADASAAATPHPAARPLEV
jgi:hypothetical protein